MTDSRSLGNRKFLNRLPKRFYRPDWDKDAERLDLPDNVKLYIRSYKLNEYIVRFHNLDLEDSKTIPIYDVNTKICSLLNDLSLRDDIKVVSIKELSLFTHKNKDEIKKNPLDPLQPDWKNANDGILLVILKGFNCLFRP